MAAPEDLLKPYRDEIDRIDVGILALLNERTTIVQEIGRVKQENNMAIYEPKREDKVYENVTRNNAGPLPDDAVKRVFERIMDEMRSLQRSRLQQQQQQQNNKESK
ncbi:MAG: chorismate mutase [Acidobacteria bacterium]|nr:chorismate mutase [Acidobacteriota bacterium]